MAAIHYERGEALGPYGVVYLEEVKPHITPGGSKQRRALFQCPYCSNTFISRIQDVKQGKARSCGCFHNALNHKLFFIDISGERYGRLTVLRPTEHDATIWICRCDCGKIIEVSKNNLISGNSTSCGCKRIETLIKLRFRDITGQRFGKLIALYPINNVGRRIWHCKCDCGNETNVTIDCLTSGNTTSCGCAKSKGEECIARLLSEYNIAYIRQHKFSDCINQESGRSLSFDFYLTDKNICIEYDGIQHFQLIEAWGGEEAFNQAKKRDKIKNDYCKAHNIPLIRIPYTQYDNIEEYIKCLCEGEESISNG